MEESDTAGSIGASVVGGRRRLSPSRLVRMHRDGGTHLRAVETRDLESTRRWRNDPAVFVTSLGRRFPIVEAGERSWFDSLGTGPFPTEAVWAVADDEDSVVGLAQLSEIHWINRTAMFGIWVGPEHWGRGHASRACALVCDHGFTQFGLRQIRLHVVASHAAARTVYERSGFSDEALLRGAVLVDGAPTDVWQMMLDAETHADRQRRVNR